MKKSRINKKRLFILIAITAIIVAGLVTAVCYGMLRYNKKHDSEPETEIKNNVNNKIPDNPDENDDDDYDYSLSESESPYLIKVNRAANCVTVYSKDAEGHYTTPIKAITCSTGKKEGDTPLGTFKTSEKYDWRLMVDGTYSQYAYRIEGEIMFHSVPCFDEEKDELEYKEYNKLGTAASLGCIRMTVRDAKWIYDNCPAGTTVVIYDDESNPGPLGKPETIKIPEDSKYSGWDPTDPDPENPWLSCAPVISNAVDLTVKTGSSINLLKHITAVDTCGNDISKNVGITGNYDLSTPGIYTVTYTVTDLLGKTTSVSAYITVTDLDIETTPVETATATRETTKSNHRDYDDDYTQSYTTQEPQTTPAETQTTTPMPDTSAEQTTTPAPTTTQPQTTTPAPTTTQPQTTTKKPAETKPTEEKPTETKKPASDGESDKTPDNSRE